jgi:hypothetical protein
MKSRPRTAAPRLNSVKTDYASILKQVVDEPYLASALEWSKIISDRERQGLKIIAAVMKHRGNKKFRNKPKENIMQIAQNSIYANSFFNLNKDNLEKFRNEYKQSMYKSAYGTAFGRKETEVADTNILTYKKFDQLPSSIVLNKTAKAFITKWAHSGDDKTYISSAILVVKGIYTFWKQRLPSKTVSHIMHAWYDPHEKTNLTRMDQVDKTILIGRITKSKASRPQTTGSNLYARKRKSDAAFKPNKRDKGLDDVTANRKKFLLRGNGNITGFYDPPEGMVSSYQTQFKGCKSTKAITRPAAYNYTSSIMTVTPDPGLYKRQIEKQDRMKADLTKSHKKFMGTDSVLYRAMNRAVDYQQNEDLGMHMSNQGSALRLMQGNAGQVYRNQGNLMSNSFMNSNNKTPMPARIQNLIAK